MSDPGAPKLKEMIKTINGWLHSSPDSGRLWDILTCLRGPDSPSENPSQSKADQAKAYQGRRDRKYKTVEIIRGASFPACGGARFHEGDTVSVPPRSQWDHFDRHVVKAAGALGLKIDIAPEPGQVKVAAEIAAPKKDKVSQAFEAALIAMAEGYKFAHSVSMDLETPATSTPPIVGPQLVKLPFDQMPKYVGKILDKIPTYTEGLETGVLYAILQPNTNYKFYIYRGEAATLVPLNFNGTNFNSTKGDVTDFVYFYWSGTPKGIHPRKIIARNATVPGPQTTASWYTPGQLLYVIGQGQFYLLSSLMEWVPLGTSAPAEKPIPLMKGGSWVPTGNLNTAVAPPPPPKKESFDVLADF